MKKENGITLLALVITVIVMLIIAGIGITAITSGEGLFVKTKEAASKYNNEAEKEAELVEELEIKIENHNKKEEIANMPRLATGMKAIKFDGGTGEATILEVENPTTDLSWYNYAANTNQWANAITKNTEGQITGYWVWIPRYEYKITYSSEYDKSQGGTIDVKFIPTTQTVADEGYIIHPAFVGKRSVGSTLDYQNGEWDKDISGFWVAKFEAGYAGAGKTDTNNKVTVKDTSLKYSGKYPNVTNYYGLITSNTTNIKYPVFLGKSYTYNSINVGDSYRLAQSLNDSGNPYGFNESNEDTHLMKNSEWGAVAYLSHSKYGVNGQNKVYINNMNLNSKVSTIYGITGYAGESVDAAPNVCVDTTLGESVTNNGVTSHAWYTTNGQKASSNNNITGVYDLSGGGTERVAAYINNTNGASYRTDYGGALIAGGTISTKYATVYSNAYTDSRESNFNSNKEKYGDAVIEIVTDGGMSSTWNRDYAHFFYSTTPFLNRGGYYGDKSEAGIFNFYNDHSGDNISYRIGLRPCVIEI